MNVEIISLETTFKRVFFWWQNGCVWGESSNYIGFQFITRNKHGKFDFATAYLFIPLSATFIWTCRY